MVWNKKAEDEAKLRAPAGRSHPADPAPAAAGPATMSPAPPPVAQTAAPRYESSRAAILGRSVTVKGSIVSQEDLTIDGDVQGSIDIKEHSLTIGPNAKVQVDSVRAREVIVMGSLKGSVDAIDKVLIRKEGQLVGDVQTAGIVIEDGAYFKGGIDIRKP